MTDFYSVLKSSITKRDLRSPDDRQEVYEQARAAMVRKLWSLDPPLSDDEIDARIGLFDDAVRRIEADLRQSYAVRDMSEEPHVGAEAPRPPRRSQAHRDERTGRVRTAAGGDHAPPIDYQPRETDPRAGPDYEAEAERMAPAGGRDIVRLSAAAPTDSRPNERAAVAQVVEEPDEVWFSDDRRDAQRRVSQPRAYNDTPQYREQPVQATHADAYGEASYERFDGNEYYDQHENPYPQQDTADAIDGHVAYEDDSYRRVQEWGADGGRYDGYDPDEEHRQHRTARRRRARAEPEPDRAYAPDSEYEYELEAQETRHAPAARRSPRRRARKRGQGRRTGTQPRRIGRRIGQAVAIAAGALAVVLISYIAYVFLPILSGSDPARPVANASPPKSDDRMPVAGAVTAARVGGDSTTATEIPERNLNVAESLVIFNGSDPTVFEGSSNNPIQFDSDSEGGFARISSATSAAGARAVIGPGLAERLAGRTVRITLLARSSGDNGASNLRFAYQSGLAISHWQSADLASNYSTYGMIWRVPATHTASGDFLLIEPGIPGDGTSTDIRLIKIDILAS